MQSTGADFTAHKAFKNPPKFPLGSLVQGNDGYFYGTTREGGSSEYGTVFKIKSDSSDFTLLKNFTNSDGAHPYGALVQGRDGFFYGMTHQGGSSGHGTIFKIGADGSGFSIIKNFNSSTDGAYPQGSLVIQCFPPTVSFTADAACEGTATALKDASTQVAANAAYAWDIDNDGTVDYTTKGNITHTYPAAGTFTAKLTIRQGNCEQSFSQQVIVRALPTATLTGDATICAGASTNLGIALTGTGPWRVTYTDGITQTEVTANSSPIEIPVSPAGTTTYSLVSVSDANCTRLVSGSATVTVNTLPAPGVYTVTLTVQDFCGQTAEKAFQFVVVYEPGGSFVTSGGWINSPAGAFVADKAITGKASFGFVVQYQKGASVPTASTGFKFKAGDLNIPSCSYEWLVVAGARALFKGEGTVNCGGIYAFLLSAIKGQISGGSWEDMVRIRIWDKVSGALVYDNNRGNSDNAALTTTLGGGSIMIHGGAGSTRLASLPQVATASANLKAYPNPFRDKTTVEFSFDQEQDYSLAVYDLKGSLIKTLLAGKAPAGEQVQAAVEAAALPLGVYFIRLTTREGMQHLRLVRE